MSWRRRGAKAWAAVLLAVATGGCSSLPTRELVASQFTLVDREGVAVGTWKALGQGVSSFQMSDPREGFTLELRCAPGGAGVRVEQGGEVRAILIAEPEGDVQFALHELGDRSHVELLATGAAASLYLSTRAAGTVWQVQAEADSVQGPHVVITKGEEEVFRKP